MDKKNLRWVLVIAWMCVIFLFSTEQGDASSNTSLSIIIFFRSIGLDMEKLFH